MSGRAHDAVGAVFQALLEAALRDAAAGAFEDEEEDEGTGITLPENPDETHAAYQASQANTQYPADRLLF